MNITITDKKMFVDGTPVATITNYDLLRDALLRGLGKNEAVYLAVALLGEARTSAIAEILGMDKANAGKVLTRLAEDGLLEIVDDAHTEGHRGRPSRLWSLNNG